MSSFRPEDAENGKVSESYGNDWVAQEIQNNEDAAQFYE